MKSNRILFRLLLFAATASCLSSAAQAPAQSPIQAPIQAQARPWSQRAANAAIARWPDGRFTPPGARYVWNYELGTLLPGMDAPWVNTPAPRYFNYIKTPVDHFAARDGSTATGKPKEFQQDNILLGRQLLLLYA